MTFEKRVRQVCSELKLSLEGLTKELRVSFAMVNRWEKGYNYSD